MSQRIKCLAKVHTAVAPVRLEPTTPRSRVKHSTTEPPPLLFVAGKYNIITFYMQNFDILAKLGSSAGRSESYSIINSEDDINSNILGMRAATKALARLHGCTAHPSLGCLLTYQIMIQKYDHLVKFVKP